MGYTISCDLALPELHPARYWWPLVFEVLRRRQFTFDNPWFQAYHQGSFMQFAHDGEHSWTDADPVDAASFRTFWDAIYSAPDVGGVSVAPTFWSVSSDLAGWDITCHLYEQRLSCWTFSLGSGNVDMGPEEAMAEKSAALSCFVAVVCDLFVDCDATTAEFNYERYGVVSRFGAIGAPLALEWWASESQRGSYEAAVEEVTLPNGSALTIINPFDRFIQEQPIRLNLPFKR
jgi:hypothetical protein